MPALRGSISVRVVLAARSFPHLMCACACALLCALLRPAECTTFMPCTEEDRKLMENILFPGMWWS